MDPYNQPQHPWYYIMPSSHMHQQPHQHDPHTAPPHQPDPLPTSPRPAAPPLPGTPTMAHTVPHSPHNPQPPSLSSPPPTPSTSNVPNALRLTTNASTFVPRPPTIKSEDGMEVTLDAFKKHSPKSPQPPTVPIAPPSPVVTNRWSIRIESEDTKRLRE
jgi:translation initiation factor 4G